MNICIAYIFENDLSRHVRVKQKGKVTDVSDSNQNIGSSCKSKLKLTEHKYKCIKSKK